ncbi:MAG: hypothetical protein Q8N53_13760 [Longimicrobiales bacterium]|nr:hypothetical protein [Longimicrobiales bacterium]
MGFLTSLFGGGISYGRVFAKTLDVVRRRYGVSADVQLAKQAAARLGSITTRVCFVIPEELHHSQNAEVVPNGDGFEVWIDFRMREVPLDGLIETLILPRAFCYVTLDIVGELSGIQAIRNGPAMPIPGNKADHSVIALAETVVSCAKLPRLPRHRGPYPEAAWREMVDEGQQELKGKADRFRAEADRFTDILTAGARCAGQPG